MTYSEKLLDPRWQKKRLEILNRDGFKCLDCGDADSTLHVHHRYYISGRHPWEYPDFCFKTLCKDCHKSIPDYQEQNREIFGGCPFDEWEHIINGLGEEFLFKLLERRTLKNLLKNQTQTQLQTQRGNG